MDYLISGYRILKRLGSGTSGMVFEAIRETDGGKLAIKIFKDTRVESDILSILCSLNHPHLLTPDGIEYSTSGELCLPFRLIESCDPRKEVMMAGPHLALELFVQACSALSYLHEHELIHGDIKPSNVLCEPQDPRSGSAVNLLLADIDSASLRREVSGIPGATGTLGYMAPEVLAGGQPTFRSDVFALGAWLYWLTTGVEPFKADNLVHAVARSTEFPPPIGRINPRFANPLWNELMNRLISPDPQFRVEDGKTALRYVLNNSSAFSDSVASIPQLIWNGNALLHEEEKTLSVVRTLLDHKLHRPSLFVLHTRPSATREIARILSTLLSGTSLIRLHGGNLNEGLEKVVHGSRQTLIVDNTDRDAEAEPTRIISILRLFALSQSGVGDPVAALVFLTPSQVLGGLEELRGLFDIHETAASSSTEFSKSEMEALFSYASISDALVEGFHERGLVTAEAIIDGLQGAISREVLSVSNGSVSIHPNKENEFFSSLGPPRLVQADDSSVANGLHELLLRVPMGVGREGIEYLRIHLGGFAEAVDEGLRRGSIKWTNMGQNLALVNKPQMRRAMATSSIGLRKVCDVLCLRSTLGAKPKSEEDLVARIISAPERSILRRGVSYSQVLFEKGRLQDSLSIIGSDLGHCRADVLTVGRWCEMRGRVLNALGEFERAATDYERAVEYFRVGGQRLLAARTLVELCVEASGWSKRDIAGAYGRRAMQMLAEFDTKESRSLLNIVKAEEAHSLGSVGKFEECKAIAESLISEVDCGNRARAICHRLLAREGQRKGDLEKARREYALAIVYGRKTKERRALSRVLVSVATFEFTRGYYARAERIMKRVLGYPPGAIRNIETYSAWTGLGGMAFEAGKMQQALEISVRTLALSEQTRDAVRVGMAEHNVALILDEMGRIGESLAVALIEATHRRIENGERAQAWNLIGRLYGEIGEFDRAHEFLMNCLDEADGAKNPVARSIVYRDLAILEREQGRLGPAFEFARQSKALADEFNARDESLNSEFFIVLNDPSCRGDLPRVLENLLARSKQVGNQRSQDQIRAAIAENDSSIPIDSRIGEIERLLSAAMVGGYGSFVLTLLRIKAELLIEKRDFERAQDVLRETLNRIKVVADGLADSNLRKTYLADPRRQKIIELIRKARNPG